LGAGNLITMRALYPNLAEIVPENIRVFLYAELAATPADEKLVLEKWRR
jgi:hypothetical protein